VRRVRRSSFFPIAWVNTALLLAVVVAKVTFIALQVLQGVIVASCPSYTGDLHKTRTYGYETTGRPTQVTVIAVSARTHA
jgi:hypothetical protein